MVVVCGARLSHSPCIAFPLLRISHMCVFCDIYRVSCCFFLDPRFFLPVTVYGTTHAHLVHMCWLLLWGFHQMGHNFATFSTYALVGSLEWIIRALNSQGSRPCQLHHPSLHSGRTTPAQPTAHCGGKSEPQALLAVHIGCLLEAQSYRHGRRYRQQLTGRPIPPNVSSSPPLPRLLFSCWLSKELHRGKECTWGMGLGHVFDGKLYFTRYICEEHGILKDLVPPKKLVPAPKARPKPALKARANPAPKQAGRVAQAGANPAAKRAPYSIASSSSAGAAQPMCANQCFAKNISFAFRFRSVSILFGLRHSADDDRTNHGP